MKKIFLSAVIALALCSYGYAQDDEEYEEEEAPAKVEKKAPAYEEEEEEEEEAAPAPKKAEKKKEKKKSSDGNGFMGIGINWTENGIADFNFIDLKFRLNPSMQLGALIGFGHYGVTTTTTTVAGVETETDGSDDRTPIMLGVEFDFFLGTPLLPTFIGADLVYASAGETTDEDGDKNSSSFIQFDAFFGPQAELVKNLYLSGKVGLSIDYLMTEMKSANGNKRETGRIVFGTSAGIELSWFFM